MINLSWKLAMVLNGQAQPALLETYGSDPLPVISKLVRTTERTRRAVNSARTERRDHRPKERQGRRHCRAGLARLRRGEGINGRKRFIRHRHPGPALDDDGVLDIGAGPRGRQVDPARALPAYLCGSPSPTQGSPAACSTGRTRLCGPPSRSCASPPISGLLRPALSQTNSVLYALRACLSR
ncbi:FAD-dependent monooxygenase [Amycolatopsis sp. NPDC049868]|uniref:FAD-dependent monooxygenase n=1 Tax=Amycolatopsis sp. NPDC049868 TaxID=3363934 RepID=UPI00379A1998